MIHDVTALRRALCIVKIMSKYIRSTEIENFNHQLKRLGFHKVNGAGQYHSAFEHNLFHRNGMTCVKRCTHIQ